jgi:signal transduction histidine kinase
VASPIVVDGTLWGAITVASLRGRLPAGAERRLTDFTELVATAVANTQAREQVNALADEQAALRRVATLVARDAPPEEVFDAVAAEVGDLLGATVTVLTRYDGDGSATAIGRWGSAPETLPVGTRTRLGGRNVLTTVYETGAPARLDSYGDADGESAEIANRLGWRSSIAAPVTVENRVWGVMLVATQRDEDRFPDGAETRLAAFTELIGTAVANAEAHVAVRTFADEQAALRRVATLVAGSAAPLDLFGAVSEEIGLVLGADATMLCRVDVDGAAVVVGTWADNAPPIGTRIAPGGTNLTTMVLETGRAARIDGYAHATGAGAELARLHGLRSAVGAPIHVDGGVWGTVIAGTTTDEPLRPDAAERLAGFTELVATAIANAQSQDDLKGLVDQQAALRRVATLVARRPPSDEVFRAVADEAGALLSADQSAIVRIEEDDTVTLMAGTRDPRSATGERVAIDPGFVVHAVRETGRPARFETDDPGAEGNPPIVRQTGLRSAVASPIIVDGSVWGAVIVASVGPPLPPDTEQRLDDFTELAATAISNATTRAQLVASRARLVTAGDEALRRVERDLHDGAQQRLLAIGLDLQRVRAQLSDDQPQIRAELQRVGDDLEAVGEEVRELSRGLHPSQLSRSGLGPVLRALARRSPIDVDLRVEVDERPAEPIETAVYYVVSEAVANAIKHSGASTISIAVVRDGDRMLVRVSDDGAGGAAPGRGSGLTGLRDRVDALGGRFALSGPPGTTISAELPVTAP